MKKIYSVELEDTGFTDDTFTSENIDECIDFIYENDYSLGVDCRIALIDEDDCFCYEIIGDCE